MEAFQTPKRQSRTLTVPLAPRKPSKKLRDSEPSPLPSPSLIEANWRLCRQLEFASLYPPLNDFHIKK